MTTKGRETGMPPLVERAERRIRTLQNELRTGAGQGERKVRELERAQLFFTVVSCLGSDDAVMPEVACAQMRIR